MTNHRGTRTTRRVPRRSRRFPLNRFARLKRPFPARRRDLHQSARQVVRPSVVRARQHSSRSTPPSHAIVSNEALPSLGESFPVTPNDPVVPPPVVRLALFFFFRAVFETFFETSPRTNRRRRFPYSRSTPSGEHSRSGPAPPPWPCACTRSRTRAVCRLSRGPRRCSRPRSRRRSR